MRAPGQQLRMLREQLGLTLRDVESASQRLATRRRNEEFAIQLSRLSDIESKGVLPSIYRLYTLSVIYRRDFRELLSWYDVDLSQAAGDLSVVLPPHTHRAEGLMAAPAMRVPVRLDPAFDIKKTTNLGRMIERWGVVPLAFLERFENTNFSYGYVGSEDTTMYPLLMPGSLVQIDESRNTVEMAAWPSEYERPIYFVETRDSFTCCWCAMNGEQIVLQPHPLSPQRVRILRHPQDAEVLGQVVGVAMRLDFWRTHENARETRARSQLT
jgi:transcriptional regulator with XRE-family HTH domain